MRELWRRSNGGGNDDVTVRNMIATIDNKIQNLRRAVEDGFYDASWANTRLRDLLAERESLAKTIGAPEPAMLDRRTVLEYRRQVEKLMRSGEPAERKRLMRAWVQRVKLEPETLEVKISYRLPESVMKGVVAGAGFEPATFGL